MKKLALSLAIVAFLSFGSAGLTAVAANSVTTEATAPDHHKDKKEDKKKDKKASCEDKKDKKSECCSSKKKSGCDDKKPEKI